MWMTDYQKEMIKQWLLTTNNNILYPSIKFLTLSRCKINWMLIINTICNIHPSVIKFDGILVHYVTKCKTLISSIQLFRHIKHFYNCNVYRSHNIFSNIRALKCIVWTQRSHGGKTSAQDNRLKKDYKMKPWSFEKGT